MTTTDTPQYEGLYNDNINIDSYVHEMENALSGDVDGILNIIDKALKTNNENIINKMFDMVVDSPVNGKIQDILKQRNNELSIVIYHIYRLHEQRNKDNGIRNAIGGGFNPNDIYIIEKSNLTGDIYKKLSNPLGKEVFNLTSTESPFNKLSGAKENISNKISLLNAANERATEKKKDTFLGRFGSVLFGK